MNAIPLNDSPSIKVCQHFPKPYEPVGRGINVKVDLTNYATKTDSKMFHMLIHVEVCTKIKFSSFKN